MSINEIIELLSYDNVILAAHGHNHLKLEDITSKIK